jgi:hypothetical protein
MIHDMAFHPGRKIQPPGFEWEKVGQPEPHPWSTICKRIWKWSHGTFFDGEFGTAFRTSARVTIRALSGEKRRSMLDLAYRALGKRICIASGQRCEAADLKESDEKGPFFKTISAKARQGHFTPGQG